MIYPHGCLDDTTFNDMQRLRGQSVHGDKLRLTEVDNGHVIQPSYEEGCPIFDFENGKLTNWTRKGEAFEQQPTYSDTIFARERKQPTGINGNWWISTREIRPHEGVEPKMGRDMHRGELISPLFKISTSKISFLVGGSTPHEKGVGVQLIVRGAVVREISLKDKSWSTLQRHEFEVGSYYKQPARIRLYDQSWQGYLMFDDLRTVERCGDGLYIFIYSQLQLS